MRHSIYPSQMTPSSQQPQGDDMICIRPKSDPSLFSIAALLLCKDLTALKSKLKQHTANFPLQRGRKRGFNPAIQIAFCLSTTLINSQSFSMF